ncbi:dGTP triphosphohydrolase, partial [Maritalea sp.]|uniref:dGTP triphosphohydrolase n=1 Tax=Maritalea sp. TaxID=2003361 RepID=UPI003EFAD0B6
MADQPLEWPKLLTSVRRKDLAGPRGEADRLGAAGTRTEIERDYDRILFSAPIRRLADKTQVFPLDKNDSVRNRLTHSHEVSNLARSIGVALVHGETGVPTGEGTKRDLPSMLAAVGLAHDVGNPPFGHQGEYAISSWFQKNENKALNFSEAVAQGKISEEDSKRMKEDYLNFEGNAQALRILTKLQILNDDFGLNVSCGTLGALMKYPVTSDRVDKTHVATKKFG